MKKIIYLGNFKSELKYEEIEELIKEVDKYGGKIGYGVQVGQEVWVGYEAKIGNGVVVWREGCRAENEKYFKEFHNSGQIVGFIGGGTVWATDNIAIEDIIKLMENKDD